MDWTFSTVRQYSTFFVDAFFVTVYLTATTVFLGSILGVLLAGLRSSEHRVARVPTFVLIEIVRSIPLIILVFWFFFFFPIVFGEVNPVIAGLSALILMNGAFTAEIIRSGISSVDIGQAEAAMSGGLSKFQTRRYIVFPQAVRNMTPALINQSIMIFKSTSVLYIIGIVEVFRAAALVNSREFVSYEVFIFVGAVYLIPSTLISSVARRMEARSRSNRT